MNFQSQLFCIILVSFKVAKDGFVQADSKIIVERLVQNGSIPNIDIVMSVVDKMYTNVNVTVNETMKDRLLLNVFVISLTGNKQKLLTKFTNFDFCRLLKNIGKGAVLKILYQNLRQNTFINSCPIKKGFYHLSNYKIDPNAIPFRLLPAGKYLLRTELFIAGKPGADINLAHKSKCNVYSFISLQRD